MLGRQTGLVLLVCAPLLACGRSRSDDASESAAGSSGGQSLAGNAGVAASAGNEAAGGAAGESGSASGGAGNPGNAGSAGSAGELEFSAEVSASPRCESVTTEGCQHCGKPVTLPIGKVCDCPPGTWGEQCEVTTERIVVSDAQSCALRSDHTIACWGFGDGPPTNLQYRSLALDQGRGFGPSNGCAVDTAGKLHCWGDSAVALSANGVEPDDYREVSVGYLHACALNAEGQARCWGDDSVRPALQVPPGQYLALVARDQRNCALDSERTIRCWGQSYAQPVPPRGKFARLAHNGREVCAIATSGKLLCARGDYVADAPPGTFVDVALGNVFYAAPQQGCAVSRYGQLYCWDPLGKAVDSPSADAFRHVALASQHGCGVRTDGSVECWGHALNMEGRELLPPSGVFTQVVDGGPTCGLSAQGKPVCWSDSNSYWDPPAGPFTALSSAGDQVCGLKPDGQVECWGSSIYGSTTAPAGTFRKITGNAQFGCGIASDDSLRCWATSTLNGPLSPPPGKFVDVAIGYDSACAVRADGALACWGTDEPWISKPPTGSYQRVVARYSSFCALSKAGLAVCFGPPDGAPTNAPKTHFVDIAVGGQSGCGLTADGNIERWGGDEDFGTRPGPFVQALCSYRATCGLRPNGRLECWGALQRPPQ